MRSGRRHEVPVHRRSHSAHQPYHAVSEMYSKEVSHRPLGPVTDFVPAIVDILREEPRAPPHSPPLTRCRENNWTDENFPIVRVPSAQFTDVLSELYDYHEVEKYSRRSVTPDYRRSELKEPQRGRSPGQKGPPPTYQVIPPTPEKIRPSCRYSGISLSQEPCKKPLPMYEEYVKGIKNDENLNPIPKPRTRSQSSSPVVPNLRHIDSSSSESGAEPKKRYVYTHDVYVDSATGRPFTPGRGDLEEKNCGKLKINVYFKPPAPPVVPTYELDEIEIEKQDEVVVSKARPLCTSISSGASGPEHQNSAFLRFPVRTCILRKEHEISTVPLARSQSHCQEIQRSSSKISERSVSNLDEIFPKMPRHQPEKGDYPRQRFPSTVGITKTGLPVESQISELPFTRGPSKTPSVPEFKEKRYSTTTVPSKVYSNHVERAGSFISVQKTPSEQLTKEHFEVPSYDSRLPKRQSPEELNYGRYPKSHQKFPHEDRDSIKNLPYTRGISKTPSTPDFRTDRSPSKASTVVPCGNVDKERTPSVYVTKPERTHRSRAPSVHERTQTASISRTPSLYSRTHQCPPSERVIPVHHERTSSPTKSHSPSVKSRHSSAQAKPSAGPKGPFEEVIHIKERFERDETIRRFYPTTTAV
ncbi:unnamed protein product [Caenorhabditis sp. 36 PRJEB53466]|nr:unnamed protein product [Caenorhabditis sp. 36 PRJEB53466]